MTGEPVGPTAHKTPSVTSPVKDLGENAVACSGGKEEQNKQLTPLSWADGSW